MIRREYSTFVVILLAILVKHLARIMASHVREKNQINLPCMVVVVVAAAFVGVFINNFYLMRISVYAMRISL